MATVNNVKIFEDNPKLSSRLQNIETGKLLQEIESIEEEKKIERYFKDSLESMLDAVYESRKIVLEKKAQVEELKIALKEKEDKYKKISVALENTSHKKQDTLKKAEKMRRELESINQAIANITTVTAALNPEEAELARDSLKPIMIKKTALTESAERELQVSEELERDTTRKAQKLESEFLNLQSMYDEKFITTNNLVTNVSATITHTMKSFDELVTLAKELLETSTKQQTNISSSQNSMYPEQNIMTS